MKNFKAIKRIKPFSRIKPIPISSYEDVIIVLSDKLRQYKEKMHIAEVENKYDAIVFWNIKIREFKSAISILRDKQRRFYNGHS